MSLAGMAMWVAAMAMVIDMWRAYEAGKPIPPIENWMAAWLYWLSGWTVFPGMGLSFLLLLIWMFRTRRRLARAGVEGLRFAPWQVVAGWFLPQTCFIRPFEVMKELYTAAREVGRRTFTPAVGVWWGCWLAGDAAAVLSLVAGSRRESGESDVDFVVSRAVWSALPMAPWMAAGILLIVLAWRVDYGVCRIELKRQSRTWP